MKRRDEMRIESYRERAVRSRRRRERELKKTRFILMNAAIALVVILIVFVVAIIKLNGKGNSGSKDYTQENIKKKDTKKAKKPVMTATPAPTKKAVTQNTGVGAKKWIRTDLDKDKPMIALSFDDGPYTPVTSKILKVLKKYDSRATFFVVGNRIQTYKEVLKESYDMGNLI